MGRHTKNYRFEFTRNRRQLRRYIDTIYSSRFIHTVDFLIEQLDKVPNMTSAEIASSMEFDIRQASYYSSAGEYLGVIERPLRGHSQLSLTGIKLMRLKLRERRLELIKLIVRHNIFHDLLSQIIDTGEFPSREAIIDRMRRYNVCKDATTYIVELPASLAGYDG